MLRLEGLSCGYGPFQAVSDLSLEVGEGTVLALIGANGAGKSSTLMTVAGHVAVMGGKIVFDGEDITAAPARARVRRGIALAPEGRRLFPDLTVQGKPDNRRVQPAVGGGGAQCRARPRAVSPPGGAAGPTGRIDVGGRAANAGDRPRADGGAAAADDRRSLARPHAGGHRYVLPSAGPIARRRARHLARRTKHPACLRDRRLRVRARIGPRGVERHGGETPAPTALWWTRIWDWRDERTGAHTAFRCGRPQAALPTGEGLCPRVDPGRRLAGRSPHPLRERTRQDVRRQPDDRASRIA